MSAKGTGVDGGPCRHVGGAEVDAAPRQGPLRPPLPPAHPQDVPGAMATNLAFADGPSGWRNKVHRDLPGASRTAWIPQLVPIVGLSPTLGRQRPAQGPAKMRCVVTPPHTPGDESA